MGSPGKQEHLPISYYNFPCAKQNFFIKLFGQKEAGHIRAVPAGQTVSYWTPFGLRM